MNLLYVGSLLCITMQGQQQHKKKCLARQTSQAIVDQRVDQYRLIKAELVANTLAAVILGASGFQNGYG